MKIKNKAWSPVVISLAGGRSINLPARGSATISKEDFHCLDCQRRYAERSIIVLPERVVRSRDQSGKETVKTTKKKTTSARKQKKTLTTQTVGDKSRASPKASKQEGSKQEASKEEASKKQTKS